MNGGDPRSDRSATIALAKWRRDVEIFDNVSYLRLSEARVYPDHSGNVDSSANSDFVPNSDPAGPMESFGCRNSTGLLS
jgi:hypothetical protein